MLLVAPNGAMQGYVSVAINGLLARALIRVLATDNPNLRPPRRISTLLEPSHWCSDSPDGCDARYRGTE